MSLPVRLTTISFALAVAVSGCSHTDRISDTTGEDGAGFPDEEALHAAPRTPKELGPMFARAASTYNVPEPLLEAISFTETHFEMIVGQEEVDGIPAAFGLMALRGEALERGATLAGLPVETVKKDAQANVMAAAALLSAHADELSVDRSDLGAWAPAVARYAFTDDEMVRAHYVHDEVYEALQRGVTAYTPAGTVAVSLEPVAVEAAYDWPITAKAAGPDYAGSIWRPSPNYNSRPAGTAGVPSIVVIHTCEGVYSGCWGWLTNSASGVSAHYVVKEDGSEISQLVRESSRAWHVGASYDCSLNGNVNCNLNGYSVNHFSIGIEHAGYASQASFPSGQIDASAQLVCDITRDNNIPRDSFHVVAHGRLQPYNRTDPGPNWPWSTYITRINDYCGGSSSIIVDSNNSNNDTSKGYIEVSANWTSSANVAGYYGTGYYWGSTQAISDGAAFWFYLASDGSKTIDAWWTAATDRSTTAPFVMFDAQGGNLGTVSVNQQTNGGKWNTLGTFNFKAGWNRVLLSRWTTAGSVVIADAVRIR